LPKHIVLSTPLDEAILRGGPYACVRYKGAHTDMKDADRCPTVGCSGVWLPNSGYKADGRASALLRKGRSGAPPYLAEATGSASTIRLGRVKSF
jgi:DNA gyrase inhibitor GyrI